MLGAEPPTASGCDSTGTMGSVNKILNDWVKTYCISNQNINKAEYLLSHRPTHS